MHNTRLYYRVSQDVDLKNYGKYRKNVIGEEEWEGPDNRTEESAWQARYDYESELIRHTCKEQNYNKLLELGPGPGVLGQMVCKKLENINYTYVDKKGAKNQFDYRKHKGNFVVKDLMDNFDVSNLDSDFDLVIANDFLEHIANPSDVLYQAWTITKPKSGFFISVPNWRMGHSFIYRGLFDYDNFLYFCHTHGWEPTSIMESPLKCGHSPKLTSESCLPDDLITSWNWYIYCEKIADT